MAIGTNKDDILERLNGNGNLLTRLRKPTGVEKIVVPTVSNNSEEVIPSEEIPPENLQENQVDAKPVDIILSSEAKPKKKIIPCSVTIGARGQGNPDNRIDEEKKFVAAILGRLGNPKLGAQVAGVSLSTAYDYMNGVKQVGSGKDKRREPDEDLRERLKDVMPKIQDTMIDKIFLAAGFVNEDTLDAIPLKMRAFTASQIMTNMMRIVDRTMPKENNNGMNINAAQVVMMTAPTKKEEDYDTIESRVIKG